MTILSNFSLVLSHRRLGGGFYSHHKALHGPGNKGEFGESPNYGGDSPIASMWRGSCRWKLLEMLRGGAAAAAGNCWKCNVEMLEWRGKNGDYSLNTSRFEATRQIRITENEVNEKLASGEASIEMYGNVPHWHIPILAMTADVIQATYEKCLKCGMDDYISKPFEEEQLYLAVARFFDPG
ncbi:hypothetical protein F3Y22_tig00112285pilonHSYRG00029 [Hibiscus syriacus]|uniref:Response regulatory domain-containing protein n=1 Tax=Hibiscus syriacus TaxID=106335 RepID=A0A6A2X1Q9_HIBSY|nr:hypothetical protein F3Y22_tig00112285pilonHSYRG00029 [Hibiscus syriacus]